MATPTHAQDPFTVTNIKDAGVGSLRQAILDANAHAGPDTIRFDSSTGPFATPQTIRLQSELPDMEEELIIDGYIEGRLWRPTGVTVSGGNAHRVFRVASGAKVTIKSLTITEGRATRGAGIANRGDLVVKAVTFTGNVAERDGGGLANLAGTLTVINSTFVKNRAGNVGGGLADESGTVTVTNCTFSGNVAQRGAGLFSSGTLLVRNTILANSEGGTDCSAMGTLDPTSTHNLIEANEGCGEPVSMADPRLGNLGGYNGPTHTIPLGGGSPAVNLGDNTSAVDENGQPLQWDQRGNGDPRYAAGITDIGAFEQQAITDLRVDTVEDTDLRGCTRIAGDCSLRGAVTLANARGESDVITFDPKLFSVPRTITLTRPLPHLITDMTIDASNVARVTVNSGDGSIVFSIAPGVEVRRINLREDSGAQGSSNF